MSMTEEEWMGEIEDEARALEEHEKRREAEWKIYEDRYEE